MAGISVGSVSVSVVPDARGFADKLKAAILPSADSLGVEAGRHIADGIKASLRDITITANVDVDTSAARAALDALGAQRIAPTVTLDDTRIVEVLEEISVKLDTLDESVTHVRLELEDGSIVERLDEVSGKLDEIGARDVSPRLGLDDSSFNRQLDEDKAKLDAMGSSSASPGLSMPGGLLGAGILGGLAASPALPGALTGAATSVGVLGLAYSQISPALQAYSAATTAAATASQKMGTTTTATAHAVTQAQAAVTAAQTQQAHDAITSAETIQNAQQGVAAATMAAANSQISAEQQLASAEYSEQQAQISLTQARQQAVLTLQQLNNASADAVLNAEQAKLSLEQAQLTQQQVDASAKSTLLQRQQAALNVAMAEQHLKESLQNRTNTAVAAQKADKAGVDGSQAVLAAQHNLAQAHQATANARRNLTTTEITGAASVAKAEQALSDARRNASWQQSADALRVAQAQAAVTYATKGGAGAYSSAATAAAAYAAQMAKLDSAGQQMVKTLGPLLYGPAGLLSKLQGAAGDAILPGFKAFIGGVKALAPMITTEVGKMGGILSQGMTAMGKAMQSSGFQAELKTLFDEGNQFMKILGPAIGQMVSAFFEAGAKSAPAVKGLADGLAAIARGVGDLFRNLAPAAAAIGSVLSTLGQAVGAVGGPLGSVLASLMSLLAPLLSAALPLFKTLLGGIAAAVSQLAKELLPPLQATLTAIGPPLDQLAGFMGTLAVSTIKAAEPLLQLVTALATDLAPVLPGIVKLLASLATDALAMIASAVKVLVPPLIQLVNDVFKALAPVLPPVEASLAKLGATLAGVFVQAVTALVPSLGQFVVAFAQLALALVPLLPPLIKIAVELLPLALKSFTVLLPVLPPLVGVLTDLLKVLTPIVTWIVQIVAAILNWVSNLNNLKGVVGDVTSFISGSWDKTYSAVSGIIGKLVAFFAASWDKTASDVKSAYNTIADFIAGSWNQTYQGISSIVGKIASFLSGSWNKMITDTKNIWNGLVGWFTSTLPGAFESAFQGIVNGISGIWNTLKAVAEAPVKFIIDTIYDQGIVSVVNAVGGLIGLHLNPVHPGGLAEGGIITTGTTPTADDVLARVSKGETVVSAAHSQILAPAFSAVGVPGYATGGIPNPIGFVQHEASSLWKSAIAGLKDLTGDAVALAAQHILDPLVNAMPGGGTVLGAALKKIPETMVSNLIGKLKGTAVSGGVGGGSGADVAKYAAGYGTGHGHPYVWGGSSPSGWDCSGFSAYVYEHFGYFPEKQGTRHGTSQSQFTDPLLQSSGAVPGALAFFNGSDGPVGHVGVVVNPKAYVSAYDTAEGTVVKPTTGSLGYRIPKGGFQAGGGANLDAPHAQAYAKSKLGKYGWGAGEMSPLTQLWQHESGWNRLAKNPSSGAYGIPQALPGSKMGATANPPESSASAQIDWGMPYIKNTYGTPSHAWALWQSRSPHWYDGGGWMPPGLSLTANGTGRPEAVLTDRQWNLISSAVAGGDNSGFTNRRMHKQLDRMIDLLERAPGRTGAGLGAALNSTARGAVQRGYFRTHGPVT